MHGARAGSRSLGGRRQVSRCRCVSSAGRWRRPAHGPSHRHLGAADTAPDGSLIVSSCGRTGARRRDVDERATARALLPAGRHGAPGSGRRAGVINCWRWRCWCADHGSTPGGGSGGSDAVYEGAARRRGVADELAGGGVGGGAVARRCVCGAAGAADSGGAIVGCVIESGTGGNVIYGGRWGDLVVSPGTTGRRGRRSGGQRRRRGGAALAERRPV
eukprot:ctg_756.g367